MANALTGDFDVVAEFTLGAANRVLAAMHCGGRLPHSWSLRVSEYVYHQLDPRKLGATGVRHYVDTAGKPIVNPLAVARAAARESVAQAPRPSCPEPETPVNIPKPVPIHAAARSGILVGPGSPIDLFPKHLNGVAQLQLGVPTVSLAANSDSEVTIHTYVLAHYLADPDSLIIPNFLRGEFQTTIAVQEVASAAGRFINVDLAGKSGSAQFVPNWVGSPWESEADQLDAINRAVQSSLQTSFEPSSTPLPSNLVHLKFKTLTNGPALAMLMDLPGGNPSGPPDPASVTNTFLIDGDDFAFGISDEFVQTMVAGSISDLKAQTDSFTVTGHITIVPNPFGEDVTTPVSATYDITLNSVTLALQDATADFPNGYMVVTIQGSANTKSVFPDVDFTATQNLTLELLDSTWGSTADVIAVGDPSVDLHAPGITPDWIINQFKPDAVDTVRNKIARFLAEMNPGLRKQLSAKLNLGDFLKSMMNPTPKPGAAPVTEVDPALAYTSFEIRSSGIVLHGSLSVPRWPKPHVEFGFYDVRGAGPFPLLHGEYNALNSWIPGGTVQEFIWHQEDGPTVHDDNATFIFEELAGKTDALLHLCLMIKGKRITAGGPIGYDAVSAESFCAWRSRLNFTRSGNSAKETLPRIALTQTTQRGGLELIGHTSPWLPTGTAPQYASNVIVHFPDQQSLAHLDLLSEALKASGRSDTASAIVVPLKPDQLAHARPADGILFADDIDAWAEHLDVRRHPATAILGSNGEITWKKDGTISTDEFAAALKQHLVAGAESAVDLLASRVVAGQLPPNFVFDSGAGGELTLRKLVGRPVVVVFCSAHSAVSNQTVRELEQNFARLAQPPALLAITQQDSRNEAVREAARSKHVTVVPDTEGEIAQAYGITIWPTTVFVDANGLVNSVSYGRLNLPTPEPSAKAV